MACGSQLALIRSCIDGRKKHLLLVSTAHHFARIYADTNRLRLRITLGLALHVSIAWHIYEIDMTLDFAKDDYVYFVLENSTDSSNPLVRHVDGARKTVRLIAAKDAEIGDVTSSDVFDNSLVRGLLSCSQCDIIWLTGAGTVCVATAGAAELLKDDDVFVVKDNLLVPAIKAYEDAFRDMLQSVTLANDCDSAHAELVLPRRSGRLPIRLHVVAVKNKDKMPSAQSPTVAMIVYDPEARVGALSQVLSAKHGLTKTEIEVCLELFRGRGLSEIAERRGRARNTIKNQLNSSLLKLDCHTQGELVAVLFRMLLASHL